jgi:DNA-binding XRE family transcriptional regulator
LRQIRASLGIGQTEFAQILDIPRTSLINYEKGTSNPSLEVIGVLKKKYSLNTDWFLTGEGSPFQMSNIDESDSNSLAGTSIKNLQLAGNFYTDTNSRKVPLLRQKVSCGPGMDWDSDDNIEEYISIDSLIPRLDLDRIFAMKAQGSSMLGAGIRNGDYLFFDADNSQNLRDGLYVFALDGDVYCKRLEIDTLAETIKIFSMRSADLEKAELIKTLNIKDPDFTTRFYIFGRVTSWIHPHSGGD